MRCPGVQVKKKSAAAFVVDAVRSIPRGAKQHAGVARILFLSMLTGVIAGLGAIAFFALLELVRYLCMDLLAGYRPAGPLGEPPLFGHAAGEFKRWLLLVLPALGGLVTGYIVFKFAPEAEGHGTDAAIDSYHHKGCKVRARVPLIKMLASSITIGTGGSAGREGPIAQIGSGFASLLADRLKLGARERRILFLAGMAGGVGAIFHAPIAGALFSAEVLYRDLDFEYEALIPSAVSSIIAYSLFSIVYGWEPLFVTPNFVFNNPKKLIPFMGLAVVLALAAILYVRVFYGVRKLFAKLRIPDMWKPAIGGLLVGVVGFFIPEALGTGYGPIQQAMFASAAAGTLFLIAMAKILTTGLTVGSGGSGGVFGPAIAIGGGVGGSVGLLVSKYLPWFEVNPGAFVVVGMAGFFAAAANAPISTIIMVSEMTGNYHLLVPALWVCVIAYLLARKHALYEKQVPSRFDSPVHREGMLEAILKHFRIRTVVRRPGMLTRGLKVAPEARLARILGRRGVPAAPLLAVTDRRGRLQGILLPREAQRALDTARRPTVVREVMRPPLAVSVEDTMEVALALMHEHRLEAIPVLRRGVLAGVLERRKVLAGYRALLEKEPGR